MIKAVYFQEKEFNRCTPGCSLQDMNQDFIKKLDNARRIAGIPFVINSAFRSVEYEKAHGRKGTSSHTLGRAVDIRCNTDENRIIIVDALLRAGFNRIGIAKTYIHVDDSPKHKQRVMWDYYG